MQTTTHGSKNGEITKTIYIEEIFSIIGVLILFAIKVVIAYFLVYFLHQNYAIAQTITQSKNISSQYTSSSSTTSINTNSQASLFNLTQTEVDKIKTIRGQLKGFFDDKITDIEVLGIFAQTDQEKERYARLFVQNFRQTTEKILVFQKYINQAHLDLYGRGSMFGYTPAPRSPKRISHSIDINNCDDQCVLKVKKLLETATTPIDLYFIGATNDADIRLFAIQLSIDPNKVSSQQITLNYPK